MKKLLKPEIEFIKFNTEDVITTSGGDQLNFVDNNPGEGGPANNQDWGKNGWDFGPNK